MIQFKLGFFILLALLYEPKELDSSTIEHDFESEQKFLIKSILQ